MALYHIDLSYKKWYNGCIILAMRLNFMEFHEQVKLAREQVHMSQVEFAKELGVAYSSLNRWELGVRKPTYALQRKFYNYCKTNGISLEDKK